MGDEVSKGTQGTWRVAQGPDRMPLIVASGLGRFGDVRRTVALLPDGSILSHEDADLIVEAVTRLRAEREEKNVARRALTRLLVRKPGLAITKLDWQGVRTAWVMDIETRESREIETGLAGPWVCVDFEDGEQYAIWKETGAVFKLDEQGAAGDDPVIELA